MYVHTYQRINNFPIHMCDIYTHIHTYLYACMHTYIQTYVRTYLHTNVWMCGMTQSYVWHAPASWWKWGQHTTNQSRPTYDWVESHLRSSLVTHVDESCHTCEWVMSQHRDAKWRRQVQMRHVSHTNETYIICEHTNKHKLTNESCPTYE